MTLDVFDSETLKLLAQKDSDIDNSAIARIQDVDLLGTSTEIESMVAARNELGEFDYIVSSHNFEHLPNPIKFLQGSGAVLKSGGILSMAVPDRRQCFDVFRPSSTLPEWIEAFFEDRAQPTQAQIFGFLSLMATFNRRRPYDSQLVHDLRSSFRRWTDNSKKDVLPYVDVHCWTFTPASFELLIRDTHFLGLSPFSVKEISPKPYGLEFYVHLINSGYIGTSNEEEVAGYMSQRQMMLRRLALERQLLIKWRWRLKNLFS